MGKPRMHKLVKLSKKQIIVLVASLVVLTAGCFGGYFLLNQKDDVKKEDKAVMENKPENPLPEEIVPEAKINIVDVNSQSRPYAVMINNISTARPYQSGLQDAYLIYEIIVEGGITRYLALFKDQDTARIGSVRSARHYYLDYVLENDAYFVHWGWSDQAKSDISTLGIDNINGLTYEGKYFYRDNSLKVSSEHRGFTKMEMLKEASKNLKYRSVTNKDLLLDYSLEEINLENEEGAIIANNVSIKYSNSITSSYKYDKETKLYYRSVNNVAHTDYVTKKQYTFKNIITYKVSNSTIKGDTKGRQNLNNIGKGSGYYITNGYAVPITWEKTSRSSQTKYYLNDKELQVNDGNTFIQIQPTNQSLNIN